MDLSHGGNWRRVGLISVRTDVTADVYECPLCFALVLDPSDHREWHEWTCTRHPYATGANR